jgi:MFS family permease
MAFLSNDAINRVNVHSGIQALAQGAGGIFFLVFMVRGGVSVPAALLAQCAILAGRFVLRPAILPLAIRLGLKPMVLVGTLLTAVQYPMLAGIDGINVWLVVLCATAAVGDVIYWPCYNAYFAALGDHEHRGHQISAREALVATVSVIAPLLGTWALVNLGPRPMFAAVGIVQALAILPLTGVPNVAIRRHAPGGFAAGRIGAVLYATDAWFDAWFILAWQIALYISLGEDVSAYGGAMALAALVGAVFGLLLGRHIDAGHGRRAVVIAYAVAAAVIVARSASLGTPWLAIASNALGGFVMPLLLPPLGAATYNLAKAAPCPLRFQITAEAGWDLGCIAGCLLAAALATAGISLTLAILCALPGMAIGARLLLKYYPQRPDPSPFPPAR